MTFVLAPEERLFSPNRSYHEPSVELLGLDLTTYGDRVTVDGRLTSELRHRTVVVPLGAYPRRVGMAHRLIVAEALSFLAGMHDLSLLLQAAPRADPALFPFEGAYGPRLARQWKPLFAELERDAATRRAVLHVGWPTDRGRKTTPCTNSLQFLIRGGRLYLDVSMRSWDVAWGLPVDLGTFGALGLAVAWAFQLAPGSLTVHAGSLHAYEDTAHLLVDDNPPYGEVVLSPPATSAVDPWARFRNLQKTAEENVSADGWERRTLFSTWGLR